MKTSTLTGVCLLTGLTPVKEDFVLGGVDNVVELLEISMYNNW